MLEVKNLSKAYEAFKLRDVSFEVKTGYITGFIGANGAGKSTTMKCILNLVHADSGEVMIFGKDMYKNEVELKQKIGFMLGPVDYYTRNRISTIVDIYKRFYKEWDEEAYRRYLKAFHIDDRKKVVELSAGMRVKLGIAMALSHGAKLIILDEPTSGLDPVARDELLDLFQSIVEDGEHSILFSTHITSDLDKCADYIVYIANGKLVASDTKDDLLQKHVMLSGAVSALTEDLKKRVIAYKKHSFGFTALIKKEDMTAEDEKLTAEKPNLEDLMIYYNKQQEDEIV